MLRDVVATRTENGWELYYAPYYYGPEEGEFFNTTADGMEIRRADRVYRGLADDSTLWTMLEELTGAKFKKIRSLIAERALGYEEES